MHFKVPTFVHIPGHICRYLTIARTSAPKLDERDKQVILSACKHLHVFAIVFERHGSRINSQLSPIACTIIVVPTRIWISHASYACLRTFPFQPSWVSPPFNTSKSPNNQVKNVTSTICSSWLQIESRNLSSARE